MKSFKNTVWIFLFALLPFMGISQSRSGGWCSNNSYSRLFNPATITDVKGTIVAIERITPEAGMSKGIHFLIKTDAKENIAIHVGPEWFLDNQDTQFAIGDMIKVKGSKVNFENKMVIIAMTISKGDQYLYLRDAKGYPKWNGWRQGNKAKRNNYLKTNRK